ncbi:MAG: SDR family NAD(P)-dependent oxidoreductase [Bradymonadaceae bacterium]
MQLEDYRIIVTGAASGLGRCFALNLAEAGAKVFGVDRDAEGLEALKAGDPSICTFTGDVSSEEDVVNAVKTAREEFGVVNGVINNAGIFRDGLLVGKDRKTGELRKMSLQDWQIVQDVNLTGTFLFAREVAAAMIEDGQKGAIVNISSCSRHGNRGQSNYSATKAGVVSMTKLWGEELARYGIRAGAVAPGFAQTPILEAMRPEMLEKLLSVVPLRRAAKPEEIYLGVKFILECDYFTGRCIDIDGGISI